MRKRLFVGLAAVLALTSGLLANGLNLNGFGARATAMGGAFVGLADDYTAVFWNPAGLALIKKGTFGLSGHFLFPTSDYTLSTFTMETKSTMYPSGILGYFQPIGDRVVVGLGAYTMSGLGANWNNTGLENVLIYPYPASAFTPPVEAYTWKSFIGSIVIAPSFAVRITDQILFGATFNINYGFFRVNQWGEYQVIPTKPPVLANLGQRTMDITGWGYGATFGLLVKPADWFSFGATYRLQSKTKLSGTVEFSELGTVLGLPESSDAKANVTSPAWLAGGVAVKPLKDLTVTFDLQWTNWKKLNSVVVSLLNSYWNEAGVTEATMDLQWANKIQTRVGAEYKMGDFAIRAGYYYDPAPAPDATMNILVPSFTYNSIAAGFGYATGGLHLDLGVEYLMGQKRTITDAEAMMPGIYTMKILVPIIGISYAF
ncbi:MAG TPA: outer membrane protein transport protein [Terriglobales bacterium]|nr:outer membrane protein transport protein [Terriglobales bacterium]